MAPTRQLQVFLEPWVCTNVSPFRIHIEKVQFGFALLNGCAYPRQGLFLFSRMREQDGNIIGRNISVPVDLGHRGGRRPERFVNPRVSIALNDVSRFHGEDLLAHLDGFCPFWTKEYVRHRNHIPHRNGGLSSENLAIRSRTRSYLAV